ncbi:2-methylcitrate dehydratase PrpD [Friedmanniella endophytica]|uniref:2-methylcitrate dehydratase PrpD n=1 Tax=Microlunatus kandeliicorticis TaxID=1759536 RepID=A0A7W3IVL7_9ACTN|nr:DUF6458 family protein [Microlunatus kandeliicorticis]MBA8796069.1 2-methylcitrate dehydratase PrpD [Microlunatus kandeliicorticis]
MGIGVGIFLLVVGAILAFAVEFKVSGIDLQTVGYICMVIGVIALVLSLVLQLRRRKTVHTSVVERHDDRTPPPVV